MLGCWPLFHKPDMMVLVMFTMVLTLQSNHLNRQIYTYGERLQGEMLQVDMRMHAEWPRSVLSNMAATTWQQCPTKHLKCD